MKFKYLNEQEFSSKATALEQVPSTYKSFDFTDTSVLDYGCGRGLSKEYCSRAFADCVVYNFDPYWNFDEIRDFERDSNPNKVITCNNVLNVIKGDLKTAILDDIYRIARSNDVRKIIFKIYERNGDGIGTQTGKDQYQRNQKTSDYIPDIVDVFRGYSVKKKGLFIIVTR